jgi:hypothetical protein
VYASAPASSARLGLDALWSALDQFACGAPQADDMSAIALYVLAAGAAA